MVCGAPPTGPTVSARLLSGTEVAAGVRGDVASRVGLLADRGKTVGLATVLVGEDAASQVYVAGKQRAAAEVGMLSFDLSLPSDPADPTHPVQEDVHQLVSRLNRDSRVDGIIVQLPLGYGLDGLAAVEQVDPAKDADGLHPVNLGRLVLGRAGPLPATPLGILTLLDHYGIQIAGRLVVIVGRSFLVGRPLSLLLASRQVDATVVQAHSRTRDLASLCRQADVLVTAVGRPGLFDEAYIKPGAVVVDVGISRTEDGLAGDVDFAAVEDIADAITPVPGGVGPMTIASLLANTVAAAEARAS